MGEVKVGLGHSNYTIHIGNGMFDSIPTVLKNTCAAKKIYIITDSNVEKLYMTKLIKILENSGFTANVSIIPAGEKSKSLAILDLLVKDAVKYGINRSSLILALGGGVVGDVAGFLAAVFMRGIPYAHVPTTLLAQVDSSVGGKVAINHECGKNLLGSFYQPQTVIIDPTVLVTLPKREIYSGMAEVIKYGLIADNKFLNLLEDRVQDILSLDSVLMSDIIFKACSIKAKFVIADEYDKSLRMLLNFGHTIGHALEKCTGYIKYTHGEAVAVGMRAAVLLSKRLGYIDTEQAERISAILKAYNLPVGYFGCEAVDILSAVENDKKHNQNGQQWILLKTIGEAFITHDISKADILAELQSIGGNNINA